MTISDHASLTHAVAWQVLAKPDGRDAIDHVDFFVDGKRLWQEQVPPYVFNDDHEVLPPWLLGNGKHVLTARVVTAYHPKTEVVARVNINVDVSANKAIAGTYERVVTKANQNRVMPYRVPSKGAFGEVSPAGKWTIVIKPNGEISGTDPKGKSDGTFVVPYTLSGSSMRLYGAAFWREPIDKYGGNKFCDPDPTSDYTWQLSGSSLTIRNVQKQCADRDLVLVGTWNRVA